METFRNFHHRSIRPKGSFPTLHDNDVILAKHKKKGKERSTSFANKMKNLKSRMNKKTGNHLGNNIRNHNHHHSNNSQANSFDQIPSKDSDVPEEEVVLMDYVDGTFEI
jgi:hypothetical protein